MMMKANLIDYYYSRELGGQSAVTRRDSASIETTNSDRHAQASTVGSDVPVSFFIIGLDTDKWQLCLN